MCWRLIFCGRLVRSQRAAGVKPLDLISRCSSGVEHFLGKEEVESSILFNGSVVFFEIERLEDQELRILRSAFLKWGRRIRIFKHNFKNR
jgi:hypothetical protein